MLKTITIDEKEYVLRADGAFPLFYRRELGRDFFRDLSSMDTEKVGSSMEAITNLTYGMIRYAGESEIPNNLEEWLISLDTLAIMIAAPEMISILNLDRMSQSKAKKKNVKSTGK